MGCRSALKLLSGGTVSTQQLFMTLSYTFHPQKAAQKLRCAQPVLALQSGLVHLPAEHPDLVPQG
jgi:hypothetical protein